MKRTHLLSFAIGIAVSMLATNLASRIEPFQTASAVPMVPAQKYTPKFYEWVDVWVSTFRRDYGDHGSISTSMQVRPNTEAAYVLHCTYDATTKKGQLVRDIFRGDKESIRLTVRHWQDEGYKISMDDFDFELTAVR